MRDIIVRVKSHRARSYLGSFLERPLDGYYSFTHGSGFHDLTQAEWTRFLAAKAERTVYWHSSITKARVPRSELSRCWS